MLKYLLITIALLISKTATQEFFINPNEMYFISEEPINLPNPFQLQNSQLDNNTQYLNSFHNFHQNYNQNPFQNFNQNSNLNQFQNNSPLNSFNFQKNPYSSEIILIGDHNDNDNNRPPKASTFGFLNPDRESFLKRFFDSIRNFFGRSVVIVEEEEEEKEEEEKKVVKPEKKKKNFVELCVELCPEVIEPVCATNGVSYNNFCEMECNKRKFDYHGKC